MSYRDYVHKQHHTVEYLGCHVDSNLSGESMVMEAFKKFNEIVRFP